MKRLLCLLMVLLLFASSAMAELSDDERDRMVQDALRTLQAKWEEKSGH
ncbi:MAG: hypothetical protein IJ240_08425 [Clostridia bacterium]|nr:hypothetical protein [Clostridia bacterium]